MQDSWLPYENYNKTPGYHIKTAGYQKQVARCFNMVASNFS
jgi:hypothetical protein